ncbi:MAG TPA: zinc-binding dehydrogenase [Candidatus Dormibacteraeota bacterium]
MSGSMWAAVFDRHGGPEVLEHRQVERPTPSPGEVLVKVRYCALNALDFFVRRGVPGIHVSLPHISGGDVVGTVVAGVGEEGEKLVGELVLVDPLIEGQALGESRPGGLAEYVAVPAANALVLGRDSASPEAYAALPIAYGTAHRMLHPRGRIQAGETIVVLGAAGGVGVACIQLAKLAGARVIACSSSKAKLERIQELGAVETVDTTKDNFSARVWQLTGKVGADLVVDYIGKDTLAGTIRCTRPGGRIVCCGASSGSEASLDLRYLWVRELNLLGSDGWQREDLDTLRDLVAGGSLSPVIDSVWPLSEVRQALARVEDREAFGKVLVQVGA